MYVYEKGAETQPRISHESERCEKCGLRTITEGQEVQGQSGPYVLIALFYPCRFGKRKIHSMLTVSKSS
jgi:hypothetical protein